MNFLIPKNLNLEKLILENPTINIRKRTTVNGVRVIPNEPITVKTKSLIKHLPYCYYLIDLIIRKGLDNKNTVKGYINLRSDLLDKVIPHITRLMIVNLLETLNVINVNGSYEIGEHSKSYKINDHYSKTDLITIEFDFNQKGYYIGESLLGTNNDNEGIEVVPYAVSFSKRLTMVEKGARKVLDEKTADLIKNHTEYRFQQHQIFHNIRLDYDSIIADGVKDELSALIEKISSGNDKLTINVNNKVNRVFSPITNLKKEYRKYLISEDHYTLLAIDFKTSHLFHLLKKIIDLNPPNELLEEAYKMKELAMNDIYQFVADEHLKSFNTVIGRKKAKDLFIKGFLYGMYPKRKINIWVKKLFPEISAFIDSNTRSAISCDLQKSEASLLNNRIFKRIALEADRSITAFGLFDSIVVDSDHFDQVHDIMVEESFKYFGYDIPLTTEDLSIEKDELIPELIVAPVKVMPTVKDGLECFSIKQRNEQKSVSLEDLVRGGIYDPLDICNMPTTFEFEFG